MDIKKGIIERLRQVYSSSGKSFTQIAEITGISKSTAQRIVSGTAKHIDIDKVKAIAEACGGSAQYVMGWVPDQTTTVRNIEPLPKFKRVPLLGSVACGEPILAVENLDGFVNCAEGISADFALKCKGDSMINARIFDGDIVFIRQQQDVDDGEIAAVLVGEDATLKRVHKLPNKLVLSPCNPLFDDLIYTGEQLNDIRILGKAVAFLSVVR